MVSQPLFVAAACLFAAAAGYGIEGRSLNHHDRLPTLRFLHIPKTGTSFIIALRNYLDECYVKDFSCPGSQGGNPDEAGPYANLTYGEVNCNDALSACSGAVFHRPWNGRDKGENVVTLLRDPTKQFFSGFAFTNKMREREGAKPLTVKQYLKAFDNQHVKMLGGTIFLNPMDAYKDAPNQREKALDRYFESAQRHLNQTVFFGISDYWNTTICLFHKELNGPGPRDSEFQNTRRTPSSAKKPLPDGALEYMQQVNRREFALYDAAVAHFKLRAEKHGCPLA